MAKIILIAAIGKNNELGKNNNLIWHFKGDMKFFKEHTINHPVIMGYNTFLSLPKLLKDRENIILTHKNVKINGAIVYNDIESLMKYINSYDGSVYIIGGASIYNLFISIADILLLTEIDCEDVEADSYFPAFVKTNFFKEELGDNEENGIKYNHVKYVRKKGDKYE